MLFASLSPESPPPEEIRWRVELFGGLRAQRLDAAGAGQVVDTFRTQKTGALLAFLVLDRRLHSREWLAEVMWPDSAVESARNSLRVSLSWLRSALGESDKSGGRLLRTNREGIGAGEALSSDLDEYRVELRRAELEKDEVARLVSLESAIRRVNGQFLRGFYDDWALAAARRFESEFLGAARRVIDGYESSGQWLRALDCARHAAMIVPESDIPLRDIVRLGLRAGESVGVKREFDAWKKRRERSGLSDTPEWHEFVTEVSSVSTSVVVTESTRTGANSLAWSSRPGGQQSSDKSIESVDIPSTGDAVPLVLRPRPLPSATSSFVGRELEREEINALLRAPTTRLVTILGAGGAGKTRLALEIARTAHDNDEFEAVAWVGASSLGSLRAIQNTMFDALGIPVVGSDLAALNKALEQSVLGQPAVAGRRTLVVFDNFEHLGEAGAVWLGTLLERAPSMVVLVTSRLALLTASERLWILEPLAATPTEDSPPAGGTASATPQGSAQWPDAVRLFVERAALVRPGFSPSPSEVKDITHVCEALGGSPLAIEVAAARLALFSPAQLALQLQSARSGGDGDYLPKPKASTMRRSGLLLERVEEPHPASSPEMSPLDWPNRDVSAPARHRTLREAIEWSARQLPPKARLFWARASVFRGPFDMAAASEVCQETHAAALLLSLRDSSLLTLHTEGEVARVSWNDALREFAQGLLSPEERTTLELRHATFFARRAREAGAIVGRGEGGRAFATFGADGPPPPQSQPERERLRVWVRHAREELDAARADLRATFEVFWVRDPDVALDMGVHLWPAWAANKQLAEGRALMKRTLEVASHLSEELPPNAQREQWGQAWEMRARALEGAGALAALSFEPHVARNFFDEARSAFERAGDADGVARTLSAAGLVALQGGDLVAARALSEQSLSLESEQQNATRRNALFNLSLVAIMSGDLVSVRALASEGLALHRAQNDRHGIALCLESLGQAALFEDEFATARVYFETARDQFQALEEDPGRARTWWGVGHVARKTGDFSEAYACFERSFEISGALEHSWALPYQLEAFALLAGHRGDWGRATRLLEGVRRIRREEAMPLPRPFFGVELDQLRAQCKKELGEGRFKAECLVGETLSHEELIALTR
ncbi:putative HTH-type transcriptional regulator [Abditibacteriota bacterium]|nr:putative HTH-type transcriptional regulator [Abditibacteriota bacterium]